MTTIAEHTVDLSLLPKNANILDLGCRGFLFADHLYDLGHNVVAVDADHLEHKGRIGYRRCAIMGYHGVGMLLLDRDPQATRVIGRQPYTLHSETVQTYTLKSFSDGIGILFWDIIKLDIEGAEYEVIMSLTEPPAKQLSIEFHLHTKIYPESAIKEMEDKLLSLGYFPVKHDKYPAHGLPPNYWDSLWILDEKK